jgi:hypothetical protein
MVHEGPQAPAAPLQEDKDKVAAGEGDPAPPRVDTRGEDGRRIRQGQGQAPGSSFSALMLPSPQHRPMLAAGASNLSTSADPNLCARSWLLTSHTTTPSPCAAMMTPVPATPRP